MPYEKIGKNEPVCIADEVPFDIPQSWEWVRFGMISTYSYTKKKINAQNADPKMWGLDLEDIEKGGRILDQKTVGERKAVGDKTIFDSGDILYSKLRPYLLKILVAPDCGICTPEIVPFKVFGNIVPDYIVAFLKCPYVDAVINSVTYGVKMPRVGTKTMTELLVPIPPLSEQKRIVEKLNEVTPITDIYAEAYIRATKLNQEFPELLKKSILQEAVQGKLVPQDLADEPASVLLERIRAEKQKLIAEGKIKKDKHESVIFRRDNSHYEKLDGIERCIDDEIPFEIPESWEWCRLKLVGITQTGNTPSKTHPEYIGDEIPFITPGDIQNGTVFYDNQSLSIEGKMVARVCPKESILQVCIGGSIGKAAIANKKVCFNQQINSISPIIICSEYIYAIMQSPYFLKNIKKQAGGTATPIINRGSWGSLLIPIAPISEQKRIIEKQRELFDKISLI